MKTIINGKIYDTDQAALIGKRRIALDYYYCLEQLYLTKKGHYFLCKYVIDDDSSYTSFFAFSEEEAKKWAEQYLSAEEYCHSFGEPEEG